jgi:hypothetical protein
MLLHLIAATSLLLTPADSQTYNGRAGRTEVRPPKITGDIQVDGRLDEAQWRQAAILTGFSEYAPVDKLVAEDSTEIFVMYTEHEMYLGIRALETHGPVNASLADRDKVFSNDYIQFNLDTFNDKRRALVFIVNPMGVQADGIYSEQGNGGDGQLDLSPDFLYQSKGRVIEGGYEVEIRIPFKSLRYQSKPSQEWGMQVIRAVQHSGHRQTWTAAARGAQSFLAQAGSLVDLNGIKRGLVMDVNPVLTQHTDGSRNTTTNAWKYKASNPELGGNIRWGLTDNLSLNATVNPDFSQVESDAGQVQYDPRQAIGFPEKRPFFLDGNENFQVPFGLIYTRRIGSPVAAAKLNGTVSGTNVGFLSAVDEVAGPGDTETNPVYNILRLRRNLKGRSTLGMVYTDREDGDHYNRVAGLDARLVHGAYTLNAQLAGSITGDEGLASSSAPLYDVRLNRSGRDWGFNVQLTGIHPDFNAESGFLSRTGVAIMHLSPRKSWFGKKGDFLEQYTFTPYLHGTWDYDRFTKGTIANDIQFHTILQANIRGGWFVNIEPWLESFKYPPELFQGYFLETTSIEGTKDTVPYTAEGTDRITNIGGQVIVNTPQWKKFSGSVTFLPGRDVNFDEWSEGWVFFTTLSGEYRPTERIRLSASYIEQRFNRVSDGSPVNLHQIPRVKLEYQVSRPVFLRVVTQYDALKIAALRDDGRTNAPILHSVGGALVPVAARSRGRFRNDILFSYQPNPGTVFFAGYGTGLLNPTDAYGFRAAQRTPDGFFVKMSYLFRM